MKSLARECLELYKKIPVLVCVYMGEALQSANMIKDAREHFKMGLKFYPNSIPLQVYNYQLETDLVEKKTTFKFKNQICKTLDGERFVVF
jgi:phytoene/squalene synthetase